MDLEQAARALLGAMKLDYRAQAMEFGSEMDALRAAIDAEAGRVSVPREPTIALRRAIIEANGLHDEMYPHDGILRADRIWQAALAAAQEGSK